MRNIFKVVLLATAPLLILAGCLKNDEINFDAEGQFRKDTLAIRSYLADSIPATKHSTGLFYQIKSPGSGNATYTAATQVKVKYAGRLIGSKETFDSGTRDFTLGNLIDGWKIGIPLIQKGGKIRLFVPSYYGYGPYPSGSIPANSVLDFEIELIDVAN